MSSSSEEIILVDDEEEQQEQDMRSNLRQRLRGVQASLAEKEKELEMVTRKVEQLRETEAALLEQLAEEQQASLPNGKDWNSESFDFSRDLREALKEKFGFSEFRGHQLAAINATMMGRDVLCVMPTGSGKSLCFQLPAVVQGGLTVVISPLISLSQDQVMSLRGKGVPAYMLSADISTSLKKEIMRKLEALSRGAEGVAINILFITPEMFAKSGRLLGLLEKIYQREELRRVVVDEAHCASMQGHDFRPDYRKLFQLKKQFPMTPLLALTATATRMVEQDMKKILLPSSSSSSVPRNWLVFRESFNRPNLFYEVLEKNAGKSAMNQLVGLIQNKFSEKSGIVYCFSQKDSEVISGALQLGGVAAEAYHANLSSETRSRVHEGWKGGAINVVCATTAFGMGIDKPNCRFVIHFSMPKSMENYVQESGRAGRDGKPANCILMYNRAEITRISMLSSSSQQGSTKLLEMIRYSECRKKCRRVLIGDQFNETFQQKDCYLGCDNCWVQAHFNMTHQSVTPKTGALKPVGTEWIPSQMISYDATLPAENAVRAIESILQFKKDGRVTMKQFVESWRGKGKEAAYSHPFRAPKEFVQSDCEQLVIHLLLGEFFELQWTHNAYATNTYLAVGLNARTLKQGRTSKVLVYDRNTNPNSKNDVQEDEVEEIDDFDDVEVIEELRQESKKAEEESETESDEQVLLLTSKNGAKPSKERGESSSTLIVDPPVSKDSKKRRRIDSDSDFE